MSDEDIWQAFERVLADYPPDVFADIKNASKELQEMKAAVDTLTLSNATVEAMFTEIATLKQSVIDGITPEGKAFLDAKLDALAAMVGTIATPNT